MLQESEPSLQAWRLLWAHSSTHPASTHVHAIPTTSLCINNAGCMIPRCTSHSCTPAASSSRPPHLLHLAVCCLLRDLPPCCAGVHWLLPLLGLAADHEADLATGVGGDGGEGVRHAATLRTQADRAPMSAYEVRADGKS